MQQLMKQAQKMQQQLAEAQAALAEAEVTGTAGGGLVTVTMSGTGEYPYGEDRSERGRPDDVETLEDLVARRYPQCHRGGHSALADEKMGPLTAGLGGGLGSAGLLIRRCTKVRSRI